MADKFWIGSNPPMCDGCQNYVGRSFTDGKTKYGPWAIMCDDCLPRMSIARFAYHGAGIGQYYELQTDGRFKKTKG